MEALLALIALFTLIGLAILLGARRAKASPEEGLLLVKLDALQKEAARVEELREKAAEAAKDPEEANLSLTQAFEAIRRDK